MEKWKEILGYEGYYEISDKGRVRSIDRYIKKSNGVCQFIRGKWCNLKEDKDGYVVVKLSKDGVTKIYPVHRLVATTFIRNPVDNEEVDHLDCNRKNNEVSNLRWVTHSENVSRIFETGNHVSQKKDYKGVNNPNFMNNTLKKRYQENKAYAKQKQSRPGSSNGRALGVQVCINGYIKQFGCIRYCSEYLILNGYTKTNSLNSVSSNISKAIKANKKYLGLEFSFI